MKRSLSRILASAMVCIAMLGISMLAHSAPGSSATVKLSVGKADTVRVASSVADVLVANPAIADVGTLRADRLYIVGKSVGDTNVLAFDAAGNQVANISIQVRADELTLSDALRQFFPGEQVEVKTVNDSIVMKGRVSSPIVANQIRDLMGRFVKQGQTLVDLMKVGGEQQVMLKVKVLEVSRITLRELGVSTSLSPSSLGRNNFATGSLTTPTPTGGAVGLSGLAEFGSGVLAISGQHGFGGLSTTVEGLDQDGVINTLAEPTLTAVSGETAGFLSGGEFPVPVAAQLGEISVDFKQFGVALNFIPTVLDNDRLSLQLTSEVSQLSKANSVVLASITIPGLTVQRAQTTVQMGSGSTLMIAGLLQSQGTDTVSGFPGLQSIPVLGNLFKSKSFQRGESELVFLVTPFIVQPYADQQAERVADAGPAQAHAIVTASHALSLSDLHHPGTTVPMNIPAPAPAGAAAPLPAGLVMPARGGATQGSNTPKTQPTQLAKRPMPVGKMPMPVGAAPVQRVDMATLPAPDQAMPPAAVTLSGISSGNAPPPPAATVATPVAGPVAGTGFGGKPIVSSPWANSAGSAVAAGQAAPSSGADPLSATFMNNMKSSYGNKAPLPMTAGQGYGYIVD